MTARICSRCKERPAHGIYDERYRAEDGDLCDVCETDRLNRLVRGEEWPPEPPKEMVTVPGRAPLSPEAARLVKATRELLEAAQGMHAAERREYGEILPCGQGRPCHVCEVIARAEIAVHGFVTGREP